MIHKCYCQSCAGGIEVESESFENGKMEETYKTLLPLISYQSSLIREDFSHVSGGFDECLINLYRLDERKISQPHNQAEIIQTIDLLMGFVERNNKRGKEAHTNPT